MRKPDPYLAFRFVVEIDNAVVAGFSDVTGLQAETETEDYREGGINDYVHKLAKFTKYPNLVLKRGLTDALELWRWYQDVVAGRIERKPVAVILTDASGEEKWRWIFEEAYPIKWAGSDLGAVSNTVFVESVEFAHHGMRKV